MNQKIKKLLQGEGGNYIFPFLWLHGEEEPIIREYMEAISSAGIGAVCIESRPHPDFCGPQWWHDMDIILDEARKRGMKVWILDDSHFPTGYANGALKDAPPELCRQFIYYSSVEAVGPMKSAQLDVSKHARHIPNPFDMNIFSMGSAKNRRHFDDDTMLSVCAARVDKGFDASTLTDLTPCIKDGRLTWDVPEGRWIICINYLTRNAGTRDAYINLLDKESVKMQLKAVYEPHYQHYKQEFGKTIAGFFSDEPELGNGAMYDNKPIGADQDLPWSTEVEQQMQKRLGDQWKIKLPLLWHNSIQNDETAKIRYTYMDIITELVQKNFSETIGQWCQERGVEYIGHMIEDDNSHARLGSTLGHYYRGLAGQHMAGIDDIGGQVLPAGETYPKTLSIIKKERDGEFYHYMLGKLGSSLANIDPIKKGRSMCEIFGAYGWGEGVRMMKYLADHFIIRGINHYVPHAFSAKPYPDPDCPPHYYADGHDPQFRHFGALMKYMNRMCELISGGQHITPAAILYHAEAEWMGQYMLSQKPVHELMDNQIDFDIIPCDAITQSERYKTKLGQKLEINGKTYKALIVPYAQYLTKATADALIELYKKGFPVIFTDALPTGITDGQDEQLKALSDCRPIALGALATELKKLSIAEITVEPAFPMLRYIHYKDDDDIYIFTNENMAETFKGTVTIPITGQVYRYDAWTNEIKEIKAEQTTKTTTVHIEIAPYQSAVIVFGLTDNINLKEPASYNQEIELKEGWSMSLAKPLEYPNFHDEQKIGSFENVGIKYPEFSGFIRYEREIEMNKTKRAYLAIEDAFEGVEVFINGESVGIQIAPPFIFDISGQLKEGINKIRIEVATTLERERYFAAGEQDDLFGRMAKDRPPVLEPSGIIGNVCLLLDV
jgi:hypothetical protein